MLLRTLVAIALSTLFLSGCDNSPRRYEVAGEVMWKGKPVKFGIISFLSDSGETGAAQVIDGKYSIPAAAGLLAGKYRVSISYPDPKIPLPTADALPGEVLPEREMLPKKYSSDSELTAEIKESVDNTNVSFKLE